MQSLLVYSAQRSLHIDVCEYACENELLNANKIFDIVFLDYQMPGQNGPEAARELRRRNFACSIVFVTSDPQFVF